MNKRQKKKQAKKNKKQTQQVLIKNDSQSIINNKKDSDLIKVFYHNADNKLFIQLLQEVYKIIKNNYKPLLNPTPLYSGDSISFISKKPKEGHSFIYRYIDPDNGKSYIGQTRNSMLQRYRGGYSSIWGDVLASKGYNHFQKEILCECDTDKAGIYEREYIEYFNSFSNGYNSVLPGHPVFDAIRFARLDMDMYHLTLEEAIFKQETLLSQDYTIISKKDLNLTDYNLEYTITHSLENNITTQVYRHRNNKNFVIKYNYICDSSCHFYILPSLDNSEE